MSQEETEHAKSNGSAKILLLMLILGSPSQLVGDLSAVLRLISAGGQIKARILYNIVLSLVNDERKLVNYYGSRAGVAVDGDAHSGPLDG